MQSDRFLKLIVVADINNLKLFSARGLKILELLKDMTLESEVEHKKEKHDSLYQKKSAPRSRFEPHTSLKGIKYQESSRKISTHIDHVINCNKDIKSLIITAAPEMLGYIRQYLSNNTKKKVIKEINKDLIHNSVEEIERGVFK